MSVSSFDIASLLQFNPSKYLCKNCYALLSNVDVSTYKESRRVHSVKCPVCSVRYLPTDGFPLNTYKTFESFALYLKFVGNEVDYRDLIEHGRTLAVTVRSAEQRIKDPDSVYAVGMHPMRALLVLLKSARYFIHFITYGSISHQLIGALKMVAQDTSVRGVISNVRESDVDELTKRKEEAPRLEIKVHDGSDIPEIYNSAPHQKLVVIDGLVALKGSANFTLSGYRKADKGREILEFVTDIDEVAKLHNRYFSRIWGGLSDMDEIEMLDIPF